MVNFADPSPHNFGESLTACPSLLGELRNGFRTEGTSVRAWARAGGVGLGTAQRILDASAVLDPSLRTLSRLGLSAGLRLEIVPVPTSRVRTSATPPRLDGTPTAWTSGRWPSEDAEYLLALIGAELRWQRRYGEAALRSAEQVAMGAGVAPATVFRLERPSHPHTLLSNAEAVAQTLGFRLRWVSQVTSARVVFESASA